MNKNEMYTFETSKIFEILWTINKSNQGGHTPNDFSIFHNF